MTGRKFIIKIIISYKNSAKVGSTAAAAFIEKLRARENNFMLTWTLSILTESPGIKPNALRRIIISLSTWGLYKAASLLININYWYILKADKNSK